MPFHGDEKIPRRSDIIARRRRRQQQQQQQHTIGIDRWPLRRRRRRVYIILYYTVANLYTDGQIQTGGRIDGCPISAAEPKKRVRWVNDVNEGRSVGAGGVVRGLFWCVDARRAAGRARVFATGVRGRKRGGAPPPRGGEKSRVVEGVVATAE